jgi:hypothetical protein
MTELANLVATPSIIEMRFPRPAFWP